MVNEALALTKISSSPSPSPSSSSSSLQIVTDLFIHGPLEWKIMVGVVEERHSQPASPSGALSPSLQPQLVRGENCMGFHGEDRVQCPKERTEDEVSSKAADAQLAQL